MFRVKSMFVTVAVFLGITVGLVAAAQPATAWKVCAESGDDPHIGPYCVVIP